MEYTGLDQNKAELGVLVFPIAFKVLPHGDGLYGNVSKGYRLIRKEMCTCLLDQLIQIFGNFWRKA